MTARRNSHCRVRCAQGSGCWPGLFSIGGEGRRADLNRASNFRGRATESPGAFQVFGADVTCHQRHRKIFNSAKG